MDNSRPIFLQIAELIENEIIAGQSGGGGDRCPPPTSSRPSIGSTRRQLARASICWSKTACSTRSGASACSSRAARASVCSPKRRDLFRAEFVAPLVSEAAKLGISRSRARRHDPRRREHLSKGWISVMTARRTSGDRGLGPHQAIRQHHRRRRRDLHRSSRTPSTACSAATGQARPRSCSCSRARTSPRRAPSGLRRAARRERRRAAAQSASSSESQKYPDDFTAEARLRAARRGSSTHWDADFAARLIDDFRLPVNRQDQEALPRSDSPPIGVIVGLASRAPLTFFDEPYLGLDAVARQIFYDRLLEDYAEHPRTMILSTH